jgi:hypothetical protein
MAPDRHSLQAALQRVQELERELSALRASTVKRDSDESYIRSLLSDDIVRATRVRSWREPHPFGSTVAREVLAEAELPSEVKINAEDVETLPRRVRLLLVKGGAEFRVIARLRGDDSGQLVYVVEEE